MRQTAITAATLRAEAKMYAIAGAILLAIGFPLTLVLAGAALSFGGEPHLPLLIGGPLLLAGYLACSHASARFSKAKAIED